MRLALTVLVATSSVYPAFAASSLEDSLAQLEKKFYFHDYPRDTIEARLDRLDNMVFGLTRQGEASDRISLLSEAVWKKDFGVPIPVTQPSKTIASRPEPEGEKKAQSPVPEKKSTYVPPSSSRYPAVTAIEQKQFGRDFANEPVTRRLERLETKLFGEPSRISDLSERVDRLKGRTGIDIARVVPPGGDDSPDDEYIYTPPPRSAMMNPPARRSPLAPPVSAGNSWSAPPSSYNTQAPPGYSRSAPPAYGSQARGGMPPLAPPIPTRRTAWMPNMGQFQSAEMPPLAPPIAPRQKQTFGMLQQVASLESRTFGNVWAQDPLPLRISRLERAIFMGTRPNVDMSLASRVDRLMRARPVAEGPYVGPTLTARW